MSLAALLPRPLDRSESVAPSAWRTHLIGLGAASGAILLLFYGDVVDIVGLWWDSSTYGHCLFLPPILAWLVWQRLPELRRLVPAVWAPGLLLVAAGGFGWLLGDAAEVALVRQFGVVLMLQGAVIACLGPAVARGLLFPLAYMLFLVPAGEELIPPLQTLTAKMCMALLALAQVPAHIEGVFISIPNGYFEVAEACSGVKFLVAMIAYGALVANVCFRSWGRRAAFMGIAVALPILANGLRAWGTIYVAYLTSSDFAVGFDHVIYGWVFFAVVLVVLMAIAWPFFDRSVDAPWFDPARLQPVAPRSDTPIRLGMIVGAVLALALLPIGWGAVVDASSRRPPSPALTLPDLPGWTRIAGAPGPAWRPRFRGADQLLLGHYRDAGGRTVDLAVALYDRQAEGRELVGYGQGAVDPAGVWAWTDDSRSPSDGRAFRISGPGPVVREVATFYLIRDVVTGSSLRVKLETLRARLFGGSQRAAAVLVSAVQPGMGSGRPAVDAFLKALGPVDRVAGMGGR